MSSFDEMLKQLIEMYRINICGNEMCETCRIKKNKIKLIEAIGFTGLNHRIYEITSGISDNCKGNNISDNFKESNDKEIPDVMRAHSCPISPDTYDKGTKIKELGNELYHIMDDFSDSKEMEIAKTKIEEAIMWAVKAICIDGERDDS